MRYLFATIGPSVNFSELASQHGTLKPVHAIIEPNTIMPVAVFLTVIAQSSQQLSRLVVIRGYGATFAGPTQIFSWIEAEATKRTDRSDVATIGKARKNGLRSILDNDQAVFFGQRLHRAKVTWLPI